MSMDCMLKTDEEVTETFRPFALKMEEVGMPDIVINIFQCFFSQMIYGDQGKLIEGEILPVGQDEVCNLQELKPYIGTGKKALSQVSIIKLNGGLGTTMGLQGAKSLIQVKDGLTFLDLITSQVQKLRELYNLELPLLFMNSFRTHYESMLHLKDFDNGSTEIPIAFVQNRYPKILKKDYSPAIWPHNPELEWNPPGHGDIYTALVTSGLLDQLLHKGYKYAFISNSDNLGAVLEESILGYMVEKKLPFIMEVARRTASDRKGGHLARLLKNNRLVLREIAQCPHRELDKFGDISRYCFFNTNSLWIDLQVIADIFTKNLRIPLDLIINAKTLDPRNPDSPEVYQLETAMGSAISAIDGAEAVVVPRSRFAPIKTTNDLLVVMSDCYTRTPMQTLVPCEHNRNSLPLIDLDEKYYKKIDGFHARFPDGVPSLTDCSSLKVQGDVLFEKGVVIKGNVVIDNQTDFQQRIATKTLIEKNLTFS